MQELTVGGGQFGKLVYLPLQELYKSDSNVYKNNFHWMSLSMFNRAIN